MGSYFYYADEKTNSIKEKIKEQSETYINILRKRKETFLDCTVVGGATITDMINQKYSAISPEVEKAYEMAYPNDVHEMDFKGAVQSHLNNPKSLEGLISGVKGKLFELKYVDYLNEGNLPKGYEAFLAESPIQKGWDIGIKGPNDELVKVFQMKASDSIGYIKESVKMYPDIDTITTHEVHSQLVMHAADTHNYIDSNITEDYLADLVKDTADNSHSFFDSINSKIPIISLSLIAFSAYTEKDASIYKKSYKFGERGIKSVIAYSAGSIVMTVTNLWWISLLSSIGIRYFASKGKSKRKCYRYLNKILKYNEKTIKKYEKLYSK